MKKKTTKRLMHFLIILAFLAYLLLGIGIYQDYSISPDEPTERVSTLINVKYVLNYWGIDKADEIDLPDLPDYKDRYYGTFLQMPTTMLEKYDDLGVVFKGRHLYTFFLCMAGYVAFFLLCRMLFHSNFPAMLGTAMIALYPRFFAEQFYNIKDMVFVSTFMIAMFASVKLIESRFKWNWILCFSIVTAVSANVRIVGIIFLMLMLGYLFLDYLTQSAKSKKLVQSSKMSDYYIKEAINYIEQNFQNNITIEDIAAICGINRSYFGKIFRNSIGRSPQEFLMNYRMVKATELLKLTSLSIAEIGSAVGYENQLHFSRAFKTIYGISPREWRNQHK